MSNKSGSAAASKTQSVAQLWCERKQKSFKADSDNTECIFCVPKGGCGTKRQSKGSSSASRCWFVISGREYCSENVNMSRANLHPMAMCNTSTSGRPSSKVDVMPTPANGEEEIVVSVVLIIIR